MQAVNAASSISIGGSGEARLSGRTSFHADRARSSNNPAARRNQAINMFLASAKPCNSVGALADPLQVHNTLRPNHMSQCATDVSLIFCKSFSEMLM